ncbi:DNA-binding response regulator, OmpR family, contains REC and winged-helix (wHTH) domain [Paenibacillus sp. 1_12]|uniref:response regulator transcription factor n=1 Tax=Paenibacillus sp. 1_12 TaxID=1566278 RepID=UPI0008E7A617|nr:response regulator transcription factor [Paenibacillus sp. 1_12]SFM14645.1 DNA-binding response regulator, OmpR family, contains REC and winged-helix (wHTH) domain [Paenibacillus sp. 1_12]
MVKILVADDEENITDVCARYLLREGFEVLCAKDGDEALRVWEKELPDFIVLDVMMPKKTGWQVCEEIRSNHDVPILMLTARGEEMDRLMGLTMGADDYMTKPFSPRELVLRVKAILRRLKPMEAANAAAIPTQASKSGSIISRMGLEIDNLRRVVKVGGKEAELTVKEFELLWLFANHPDQVFSRNQLLNTIWDIDYFGDTTTVTVHIRRLREKIEKNPSAPKYIKTVWGIGYKFDGKGGDPE